MLTYNRPQRIGRAIASACDQSFADWELLIIQDGTNHETSRLLADWLAREPRIRHVARGVTGSIAEASNFGLELASGDYVAILDDDDSWCDREKLADQVEFLDTHPEYVACGGGYTLVDEDGCDRGTFLKPESDEAIRERALLANPVANSTAMFRRVVQGRPVLYDTSIRQFADWDFWLTMGSQGKLYNAPAVLAHYALWGGGSSFLNQRANGLAALRIVRKHRHHYQGFAAGMGLAYLYLLYACLPAPVRRLSYSRLSASKKSLAGTRSAQAPK